MMTQNPPVLFVDDDENLLMGLKRKLRGKFDFETAVGPLQALEKIKAGNKYAVCVADMRMPDMDGVKLLAEVAKLSPDTVNMMLTGNADQHTAVEAINRGHIFRFFNKPCEDEDLIAGVKAGLRQYQLITAEKALIEQTLAGSVKVLTEVLAQLNPAIFGKAMRAKLWCDTIAKQIGYPHPWELGLAALLAPIGYVSLPPEILARLGDEKPLQPLERDVVRRTPEVARKLISNIPRLEHVAGIVYLQNRNFDGSGFPAEGPFGTEIPLGARVLRIFNDLGKIVESDLVVKQHFDELRHKPERYDPELLNRIEAILAQEDPSYDKVAYPTGTEHDIYLKNLRIGDFLLTDIETRDGHILLTHGNYVSEIQIQRLRVFQELHQFHEPIRVRRGGHDQVAGGGEA
ncbi:HD domain-containing phosphohydrolase [Thalassospira tepidiphila]|uniref:HD domain-containing phosphohydrolase n=1 Tax=Thalassospira tepidiphila TaxID=393657 RepID=UPI0030C72DF4